MLNLGIAAISLACWTTAAEPAAAPVTTSPAAATEAASTAAASTATTEDAVATAAGTEGTYAETRKNCSETGTPMVVLVGADWCPACKVMKDQVLPQIRQQGVLRRAAFALVNFDRDRELASQLTAGGPIPQLLVFRQDGTAWRVRKLIGGYDAKTVENFIAQGIDPEKAGYKTGKQAERSIPTLPGKAEPAAVAATPASQVSSK
jgi:thiol:disulfide interchange protein